MIIPGQRLTKNSLDETLHNADACSGCKTRCCEIDQVVIPLSDEELKQIPSYLRSSQDEYAMHSTEKGCAAFTEQGCSIFDHRPLYCRIYPLKLVELSVPGAWGGEFHAGYALVLGGCALALQVDFAKACDSVLKVLEKDSLYFDRLKHVVHMHESPIPKSQLKERFRAYKEVEFP